MLDRLLPIVPGGVRQRSHGRDTDLVLRGEGSGGYSGASYAFGDVSAYEPTRTELHFKLGTGGDTVSVDVLLATLRFPERGIMRVTAQAIVRQATPPA